MRRLNLFLCCCLFTGVAQADPITYTAILSGLNEAPPNASPATGAATVIIDTAAHSLTVDVAFAGLTAPNTAAHIHCCTALPLTGVVGVATVIPTFTGFPTGATSGTYFHVFDLTLPGSFNASFVTANGGTAAGAEAVLAAGLDAGKAYLNIHTSTFPGGEIRGFLITPEPSTLLLLAFPFGGLAIFRLKNRLYPRGRVGNAFRKAGPEGR